MEKDQEKCSRCAAGADADATDTTDPDPHGIRDALAEVDGKEVGSEAWRQAVAGVREANSDHMGEEERESLADFRRHASLQLRHDLAVRFAAFEAEHAGGIRAHDLDVDDYIERTSETRSSRG